jgi:hypothetical protein
VGAAINYRQQQIELQSAEADLQRGLASILSEEKWRHEREEIAQEEIARHEREEIARAEIAREDRDRKAREADIACKAYEEEQKRRGVTEWEDWQRERGTLGEHYPAFAPGCGKTKIPRERYDEDQWEKTEENYSADRRLTGQFFWNQGLENDGHYGAGRFSSLIKSAAEQEVTFAEADQAAKIYKRRMLTRNI